MARTPIARNQLPTIGIVVAVALTHCTLSAQQHKGSPQKLAVDAVLLANGKFLYGIVTQRNDGEIRMVVRRSWLESNRPEIFRDAMAMKQAMETATNTQLADRIDQWLERTGEDKAILRVFLEDELKRVRQTGAARDTGEHKLVSLLIPVSDVDKVFTQTAEQHRIAGIAWKHNLKQVSVRTATSLSRELQRNGVDIANESFDFGDQLAGHPESAEQWAIRQALVEYEMTEPLRFQGTGTSFFRADQKPGMAQLIQQLTSAGSLKMLQQVGEELEIPEFMVGKEKRERQEKNWWKGPAETAAREGVIVFQVTRLHQQLLEGNSSVSSHLFAQLPDGSWREVVSANARVNVANVKAEDVDFLRDDPRIKQVIETFGNSGLGNIDDRLEQALRQGAATNVALIRVRGQIGEFAGRYRERLDGPPVPEIRAGR